MKCSRKVYLFINKYILNFYLLSFLYIYTYQSRHVNNFISFVVSNKLHLDVMFFIFFIFIFLGLFIVTFIFLPITPSFVRVYCLDSWVVFTTLPTWDFLNSAFPFFVHLLQKGTKLVKACPHISLKWWLEKAIHTFLQKIPTHQP